MERWDILKVLNWTKGYLSEKGVENARLEAEWMLCDALALDRVGLYLNFDKPLTAEELARFRALVARRARREPLQYILGSQEFMGLSFEVAQGVLIPRHDTEVLVAAGIERGGSARSILDIGTGSGCIAIALARALPGAGVVAVELSDEALEIARRNAERNEARVEFHRGSLFAPFAGRRFDLILSNPPYIPAADLASLQQEVRDFEPTQALDGGVDGLDFYRTIVAQAPEHLNPEGWLIFEVGIDQARAVHELLRLTGFREPFTARDPAGIDRVVGARLGQAS